MAANWKTIRVFISSTFCEMQAEREVIDFVAVTFSAIHTAWRNQSNSPFQNPKSFVPNP
jgi:hypothetical protein